MISGDETSIDMLKARMDLFNIQHFLLHTPPGYKRDQLDAELRKLWARWDAINEKEINHAVIS